MGSFSVSSWKRVSPGGLSWIDRPDFGYSTMSLMMVSFYTTQLTRIYDPEIAVQMAPLLQNLVEKYRHRILIPVETSLTERDSILITYSDQIFPRPIYLA
jgi:hypothetical protein